MAANTNSAGFLIGKHLIDMARSGFLPAKPFQYPGSFDDA
jgi:hypothetical protein